MGYIMTLSEIAQIIGEEELKMIHLEKENARLRQLVIPKDLFLSVVKVIPVIRVIPKIK